jgi:hypothetical protein
MKIFALKNLSSKEVKQVDDPLTMSPAADFPTDKAKYNEWKSLPTTEHCFYNCTEGLYPTLRVDTNNPPKFLHGFVCEFDSDITEDMVDKIPVNGAHGLLPTWVSRSRFRNGRRLVFEFEAPVFVDNPDITERFLKAFAKEAKLKKLLPGLDETWFRVTQYQELGIDWKKIPNGTPINSDLLSMLFFKAAAAKPIVDGINIPLDKVALEVEKRWPGKWPGKFEEGVRGPLFWVDPYVDRVGCQIGEYGMICYSDRAGKSFCSWREVLGAEFVRNFEAAQIGRAVEGVWFDNQYYWARLENGRWAPNKKEDIAADLKIKNHLKPPQVEEVLSVIRNSRRVTGVFPFIHNKADVIPDDSGALFLNISTRKVIPPAKEDRPFPWLAEFVEKVWDADYHDIQRDTFLAWFQRLYKTAYEGNMKAGQAIVIAGDIGLGKTLFSRRVIGAALGGFTDASNYLLSKTAFNKEAAETAVWAVDDDRGGSNWEMHDNFSNAIKKYVANPQIPYHPKYKDETTVTWRGRIIVTCNADVKSLSILPEVDESIEDKIMLFKLGTKFIPSFKDVEDVIRRELPFFLRWLLSWNVPKHVIGDERFGVKSYHHPELLDASIDAAPHGQLTEMLMYAIKHALPNDEKLKEKWMNNTEIRALLDTDGLRSGLAKFNGNRLGIALSKLPDWLIKRNPATNRKSTKRSVPRYLVNLDESTYPK